MGLTDKIIQATDTIVSQRLGEVSFDRTVVCTVVEKKGSTYWVDNGSIRFYADALDGKQYSPNQKVYVTVPEGNYNKRKIIMGGYTESEVFGDKFIVNPYDKTTEMWYADISDQKTSEQPTGESGDYVPDAQIKQDFPSFSGKWDFNNGRYIGKSSDPYKVGDIGFSNGELLEQYGPLEYFGIDIRLDCNLFNYLEPKGLDLKDTIGWEYGLKFDIKYKDDKEEEKIITHEISSKSFYGNPYCLLSNETLHFIFDLPKELKQFTSIIVTPIISESLYNHFMELGSQIDEAAPALKYLRFHAGYTTDTIKEAGILILSTVDPLNYDKDSTDSKEKETNRSLYYRWYDEENDKIYQTDPNGTDSLIDSMAAHWIYYDKDRTIKSIAENYNKSSDDEIDGVNHQKNNEIREGYEKLYGKYWWPISDKQEEYSFTTLTNYSLNLNEDFKTKEVKVVLIKDEEVIAESNTLTFVNMTKEKTTSEVVEGSNFKIDDAGITIGATSITWSEFLEKLKPEEPSGVE